MKMENLTDQVLVFFLLVSSSRVVIIEMCYNADQKRTYSQDEINEHISQYIKNRFQHKPDDWITKDAD